MRRAAALLATATARSSPAGVSATRASTPSFLACRSTSTSTSTSWCAPSARQYSSRPLASGPGPAASPASSSPLPPRPRPRGSGPAYTHLVEVSREEEGEG
jgi:hypothetical protein